MEIVVYPRSFGIRPGMSPDGSTPVMHATFLDAGGTIIDVVLGLDDWTMFQHWVADHESAARAAKARERILVPGDLKTH
jgi:hypothetical protein